MVPLWQLIRLPLVRLEHEQRVAFLPSRVLAAGLGRRSAEAAFIPDLGLPGATRRLCGATWARLVAFAAASWRLLAGWLGSSAFAVIVNLLLKQNAGFRTSISPM